MAEGGCVSSEATEAATVDIDLPLECPICYDPFCEPPKLLPCRHSFCQKCLATHIINEVSRKLGSPTSFSCPVCRGTISPIDKSQDMKVWAQQFPTNTKYIELLKSQSQVHCTICKGQHKDTPARFLCKITKNYLCGDCKTNLHDYVHPECDITEFGDGKVPVMEKEPTRCKKHKKKVKSYCEDDQMFGCEKCMTINHRRCKVMTTKDYVQKLQVNSQIKSLVGSLRKGINDMALLEADFKQQLKEVKMDKQMALDSIDRCLEKMKQDITDDLKTKVEQIIKDIEAKRRDCECLRTSNESTLDMLERAVNIHDYIETVSLFQRGQEDIATCEDMIQEMKKSFTSVIINYISHAHLTTLPRNTSPGIGKIDVHNSVRNFPVDSLESSPLSHRRLTGIGMVHIKCPSDVKSCLSCGVLYLQCGSLVVSDGENCKVKLFSEEGDCLDEKKFPNQPFDMCLVDNNTVAVLTSKPTTIETLKVASSKLSLHSTLKGPEDQCYGITYVGRKFIVSGVGQFYCITTDDQDDVAPVHRINSTCLNLAYDPRKQHIITGYESDTPCNVAIISLKDGHEEMLEIPNLEKPVGVDIDREGNIYFCGQTSGNVMQLSADGNNIRKLLTSADGIEKPRAISVCGDRLVVTNHSSKSKNYIHLFQFV